MQKDRMPEPSVQSNFEQMQGYRILDANANRASEGIRTLEEIARFAWNDSRLAEGYKQLRHRLTQLSATWNASQRVAARDTPGDVGTAIETPAEMVRSSVASIASAACGRLEQSLRCLEEFSKLVQPQSGRDWQSLRYTAYELNIQALRRLHPKEGLAESKLYILVDCQKPISIFSDYIRVLADHGADIIQLREKNIDDGRLITYAQTAVSVLSDTKCKVIINDRPDIMLLSGAAGVHLGQEDLSARQVRMLVGPEKIIGVSTHNIDQAVHAVQDGADYIGCGPTFPSQTKTFDSFPGLEFLRQIAKEIQIPAFAIGGITKSLLPDLLTTGVDRIAVSAVVHQANSPAEMTQQLARLLTPKS